MCRTLSLFLCSSAISLLFFLTSKHSCPVLTVKLFHELQREAGVTTTIQFPYEQLPCRQGWQFIYFNLTDLDSKAASPAIVCRAAGTGSGLMGLVRFTGIQLLWPKYANTFKVGPWPEDCPIRPRVCVTRLCVQVCLPILTPVCMRFLCVSACHWPLVSERCDVLPQVRGCRHNLAHTCTHTHARTHTPSF